jgi:quinol monooxygenase YgiN
MIITKEGDLVTLINVFETTPEQQQALIDGWTRFTEEVKDEMGFIATALHKSRDGSRVVNYAQWRSSEDFDHFLQRHGQQFALFGQFASRIDPHIYDVVYLYEQSSK